MSVRHLIPATILTLTLVPLTPAAPRERADRYGDPLPAGAVARLGSIRFRYRTPITALAFTPDGKRLAVAACGNEECSLRLWDTATAREVRRFENERWITCLAFSPDGKLLAEAHDGDYVRVWDAATGREVRRLYSPGAHIGTCAFSADGKILATEEGRRHDGICLWNAATGRPLRHIKGPPDSVEAFALSRDGKTLAAVGRGGRVRVWDASNGRQVRQFDGGGSSVALSPDGKLLASGHRSQHVRVWDVATGKRRYERRVHFNAYGPVPVAFSPDGKLLAAGGMGGVARVWDAATGGELHRLPGHPGPVTAVAFSAGGRTLATGGGDLKTPGNIFCLWDVATGKQTGPAEGHCSEVTRLTFSPAGVPGAPRLVSAGSDGTVRLWEPLTGKEISRWEGPGYFAVFSPDGSLLAAGAENSVEVRDRAGRLRQRLTGWTGRPVAADFSPDGTELAVGNEDGLVRLWDAGTGKRAPYFEGRARALPLVAIAADGRKLRAVGAGGVRSWDLSTGRPLPDAPFTASRPEQAPGAGSPTVLALALSADRKLVAVSERWKNASGRDEYAIRVREVATGGRVLRIEGRPGPATALAFSPDGRTLAAGYGGRGPVLVLWDLDTGKRLREVPGHANGVRSVAFSPDGHLLASGSADTTILVWDAARMLPARKPGPPLSPTDLAGLWADLAGPDSARAYRALAALVAAPGQSVPLIRKNLPPVPRTDRERRIAHLIADLDADAFRVRQQATADLERLGRLAEPAMRRELKRRPTLEVRRRIERILKRLPDTVPPSPPQLRILRAVAVLERVGNRAAWDHLERLSGGEPGAEVTQEARAALVRLHRRGVR